MRWAVKCYSIAAEKCQYGLRQRKRRIPGLLRGQYSLLFFSWQHFIHFFASAIISGEFQQGLRGLVIHFGGNCLKRNSFYFTYLLQ